MNEKSVDDIKEMEYQEMKRKGNIYEEICKIENVKKAILKATNRKKYRLEVEKVYNNIDFYALEIQKMLISKSYVPNPYIEKKIYDGARQKERIIYKPKFYPDQCIHWCLMLNIQDILARGMYQYSCACVKNRGILYGVKYIKKILVRDRKNTKYCLKLDIKKYYPSVNKENLKRKFMKVIKDRDTLDLIECIIDSSNQGLPIGNYTSQWFANFYLQDLDHFIKEELKIPYYIRYMDDMVLFHRNKKELHKSKEKIEEFLKKEGLRLKENWQLWKTESRPLDFLGYRFYRGYTTLRSGNFLRIRRRLKKISKKQKLDLKDAAAVVSYRGYLKHANTYNYQQKYVRNVVDINKCKEVIRNENRKQLTTFRKV